jgi:hypothetical protein
MRAWIEPGEIDPSGLVELLQPYPADLMEAYPVGRDVNSAARDGPNLIEPQTPVVRGAAVETGVTNVARAGGRRGSRNRAKPHDQPQLF